MTKRITVALTLLMATMLPALAQSRHETGLRTVHHTVTDGIDRQAVVRRNNPEVRSLNDGTFMLGNGHMTFTADATGLQTFEAMHRQRTPLQTEADWAWNTTKTPVRHWPLATIGLALTDPTKVQDVDATLDLWTGRLTSRFTYNAAHYTVQTVCDPDADVIATHVKCDDALAIVLRFPSPPGGRNASNIVVPANRTQFSAPVDDDYHDHCLFRQQVGGLTYFTDVAWRGSASLSRMGNNEFVIRCAKGDLQLQVAYSNNAIMQVVNDMPLLANVRPFIDWSLASATGMANYWTTGGMVDFSKTADPQAQQLERRVVNALFRMRAQQATTVQPTDADWWRLAQFGLWERPDLLENRLTAYSQLEKNPYYILLAELLYRAKTSPLIRRDSTAFIAAQAHPNAAQAEVLKTYGPHVDHAAAIVADSLSAEAAAVLPKGYRRQALLLAQQWRMRMGRRREARWDSIAATLPDEGARTVALSSLCDGELLAAVASMLVNKGVGLQSSYGHLPKEWVVRWESIEPMLR